MPHKPDDAPDLTQVATELVMAAQAATLRLLGAELQVLAQMMPVAEHSPAQALPTEADIEEGFDNMPV